MKIYLYNLQHWKNSFLPKKRSDNIQRRILDMFTVNKVLNDFICLVNEKDQQKSASESDQQELPGCEIKWH
jgi:hypothetical protein